MHWRNCVLSILVCVVTVSGCASADRGAAGDQSASQSTAADARQNPSATPQETSGAATVDTAKVLAKATYDAPFAPKGTVDIAVHGLKRRGKLLDLTISVTPHNPENTGGGKISLYRIMGERDLFVTLIDTVNLKRHLVVKDAGGDALGPESVITNTTLDQQLVLSYTFAAPPENVTKMDVHVGDWAPFTDVPVES